MKRDYNKLKALFISGMSLADIAKKYKISYSTLANRSSKENWTKQKLEKIEDFSNIVVNKTLDSLAEQKSSINLRHIATADKIIDLINLVLKQAENKKSRITDIASALSNLANSVEKSQKIQRLALKMDTDEADSRPDTAPQIVYVEGITPTDI